MPSTPTSGTARVDLQRIVDLMNIAIQYIGHNLTPQIRQRATAGHANVGQAPFDKFFDVGQQPLCVVQATPSKTAQAMCVRVVRSDWLKNRRE